MATKKHLVEAHAFSRRRLVTAFVSGAPGGRELVTIRLDSKWKLKSASWGPVTKPEPAPEPDPEVEPDPLGDRWKGLDVAVGR